MLNKTKPLPSLNLHSTAEKDIQIKTVNAMTKNKLGEESISDAAEGMTI